LLGEILEKLASMRMNITIRLDGDREEGDPVCSTYILIFIDFAGICSAVAYTSKVNILGVLGKCGIIVRRTTGRG